jgi:hypothetical protein
MATISTEERVEVKFRDNLGRIGGKSNLGLRDRSQESFAQKSSLYSTIPH